MQRSWREVIRFGAYFEGRHKEFEIRDMGLKEWQRGSYQADAVTTTWTERTVETRLSWFWTS